MAETKSGGLKRRDCEESEEKKRVCMWGSTPVFGCLSLRHLSDAVFEEKDALMGYVQPGDFLVSNSGEGLEETWVLLNLF